MKVYSSVVSIGCVAEGDEDHLISRVGKPQDLQLWWCEAMLV